MIGERSETYTLSNSQSLDCLHWHARAQYLPRILVTSPPVRVSVLGGKAMTTSKGPDSVDQMVGRNIRIYRLQKKLTQTELADELGLTFQQVQKYEKGTNRVGSGRLLKIAMFLDVPVTALFKGSDEMADTDKQLIFDQLARPHANRLLQAFGRIDHDGLRLSVVQLVEQIANKH